MLPNGINRLKKVSKATLNAWTVFRFQDRATPLFIAAQNGHYQILLFLLSQGAEPDPRRTDGATPLWIASQMGHHQIVRELLLQGARVDTTRHVSSKAFLGYLTYSLKSNESAVKQSDCLFLQDGATPLFKAAHKGHSLVISELLKYKPSLDLLPVSFTIEGSRCKRGNFWFAYFVIIVSTRVNFCVIKAFIIWNLLPESTSIFRIFDVRTFQC